VSKGEGRTVLFVSHSMASVKKLCNKGIVLEKGKIVYHNDAGKAVDFYLTQNTEIKETLLINRIDRKGSGEIKFSKIELFNKLNQNVNEIESGEYVIFRLHIDIIRHITQKGLVFGVVFRDNNETKIADFYSDEMGVNFTKVLQNGYVDLEIEKLMLRGGNYYIDIVVQNGKIAVNQIDLLHRVFNFTVFQNDYWNSGKINRATNVALIDGLFKE